MYTYTGIKIWNVRALTSRLAYAEWNVDAFSPTVVAVTGTNNIGTTITSSHNGKYSFNGIARTAEDVTGTSFSKVVTINGSLAWTETWSDGTDLILDATDYSYELTKLSGNQWSLLIQTMLNLCQRRDDYQFASLARRLLQSV